MPIDYKQQIVMSGRQLGKSRLMTRAFTQRLDGVVVIGNYNNCINELKDVVKGSSAARVFRKALIPLTIDSDIIENQDKLNDYERLRMCMALASIIELGMHKDKIVGYAVDVLDRNWRLLPEDVIEGFGNRFKALLVIENL